MVRTLKFVYVIILILSLFLVAKGGGKKIYCENAASCPRLMYPLVYKCLDNKCVKFMMKSRFV
ncbi:putative Late nodulin [Medicago truncatula]|uniref:Nodule Cysteine-Rich (NCR) secreted peptide n=1 Tax=Medicago truncatula TaxID=3880 RepID=A7KH88_MEDTR|nr:nodule-specific cysteine-rich peptide 101 [Medicago truncatula]AES68591.1 Nodule Cysteine-Rich (NCR) secreted peptide [Medicago truncatula]RHN65472.1 putative Late nodulin [Medicago truncatula]